ncbi:peptide ABC transporter substrate-binding protein [Acidisphaera sp. L21]|uniref:peptide ABC transporter substrate-binding protein n=1 Tax=Acidisphaera sp. L21 TaxID=1641851 RepID=UPI00131BD1CE|nr:peptide ABC transporter substrate-binding protein [Acidisphaera sp. L21]
MTARTATIAAGLALAVVTASAQAKDHLTIGVAQFPNNLHPYIGSQTVQGYVDALSLHRITVYDTTGKIVCLLCTEAPSLENGLAKREKTASGGDGLAVTIKLKPGLMWGDGVKLTAKDLAFTWKVGHDPNAGFANVHPWSRATSVDVVDDQTAVLHLDRTVTSYALWDEILPEHLEGPILAAAKTPADYINTTLYNRAPTTPGLWNGPFLVSDYKSNISVSYKPNPFWTGTKPGLKEISVRLIENTAALQANLLSGDVDMTPAGIGLSIDQVVALQKQHGNEFRFIFKPQLSYEHIDLQLSNPILQDERVRKALLHGIDVKAIVDRLFGGYGDLARTFINSLDSHFITDLPTYPFDPARARALLDEAGWKPGSDGIRRNDKGDRLTFEFATTSGARVRELTQQVMQSQWKAIGVEVTIKNQPSRSFFGQLLKHREFTGMAEYASTLEVDLTPWARLSSPFIPLAENNWGGQNYSGISDPKMDADIAAAQYELDPTKQQALWADMQRIYSGKLYALPLYFRVDPDVVPLWLDGYQATGKETYSTYSAADWHPN